ncbi:hypothetical protein BDY19DRAFT_36684 [Irpex rosettiformis]|uniref:Uncharacterized protein n=1 Tax=Irpex rosettiformis TaxID=378272 RepID=A0ACB8UKM5_9APHY|nr:hypothetical protein BDY19DRAFT_36684 [Irpex rosettiformis]
MHAFFPFALVSIQSRLSHTIRPRGTRRQPGKQRRSCGGSLQSCPMYSAMVYYQLGTASSTVWSLFFSSVRFFSLGAVLCLYTSIELSTHSFLRNRPTLCIPSLPPSIALREEFLSSPPPLFTARSFLYYSSRLLYHLTHLPPPPSLPIPFPFPQLQLFSSPPASVHPSLHLFTAHCLNRLSVQPFSRLVNVATISSHSSLC